MSSPMISRAFGTGCHTMSVNILFGISANHTRPVPTTIRIKLRLTWMIVANKQSLECSVVAFNPFGG